LLLARDELIKVAGEVMQSSMSSSILQQLDTTRKYLILMMAYLGYEGLKGLKFSMQLVPKSFGNFRKVRVCNIINHFSSHDRPPITETVVEELLPVLTNQDKNYMLNSMSIQNLILFFSLTNFLIAFALTIPIHHHYKPQSQTIFIF